jgi:hypothetical protein
VLFSPLSFISQEGKTALDIAREKQKKECAEGLERQREGCWDLISRDEQIPTPLPL